MALEPALADVSGSATLVSWRERLRLPVIAAPLFLISNPKMVIAQCTAGVIGTLPALNARPSAQLDEWLAEIVEALSAWNAHNPGQPAAPFGINLVVHRSNVRFDNDLELCARYKVPLIISSMGARAEVNATVQGYGGVTLHDVTNQVHARKAIDKGATGLIAVAAGAGGHAGALSPFALMQELRDWFDGPLVLAGAIASGRAIAAARLLAADFAYVGSAFIATTEACCARAQKDAVVASGADDIVYTPAFSGTPANYLRSSIVGAGLDPDNLPAKRRVTDVAAQDGAAKTWTDIWGCGQGIGTTRSIEPVSAVIERLAREYDEVAREF